MSSPIIKASVPLISPAKAKVILIAWDPESLAHTERMVQQRIACGWKHDYVELWRVLQREGKMALHWVVHSEDNLEKETELAQHLLKYPGESTPIIDTATALGGRPRTPSLQSFTPIGHISLDTESPDKAQAEASKGLYYITTLYVSRAIQGSGHGRAAMDAIESHAISEPWCAKVLSLDTLTKESMQMLEMSSKSGMKPALFSRQEWYERRRYKAWKVVEGYIQHEDLNGKVWPLDNVYLKKIVG